MSQYQDVQILIFTFITKCFLKDIEKFSSKTIKKLTILESPIPGQGLAPCT